MAAEGCMVQRSPACSVRHIHIAEQRYEGFGAAYSLIGRGDVKRRLPVLVSGVYVGRVFQQNLDSLLQEVTTVRCALFDCGTRGCDKRIREAFHIPHCRRPQPGAEE